MSVAELEENEVLEEEVIEVEEVDEEVDNDQTEDTEANADEESSAEESSDVEDESDDIEISLDGVSLTPKDEEDKSAPQWAKDLRKNYKDTSKENRDLKKKLELIEQTKAVESQGEKPHAKPTLEDFDYDQDEFQTAYDEWYLADRKLQEQKQNQETEIKRQNEEWQERLNSYEVSKKKLKVRDYDDADSVVEGKFNETQRGVIIHASENPALTFYAIGKNEKMAEELANIKDPVKFAFAVSKMESKLKTTTRKARTNPESSLKSTGGAGKGKDHTLERLEAEADKTGNRTKVAAYKSKLRAQERNK